MGYFNFYFYCVASIELGASKDHSVGLQKVFVHHWGTIGLVIVCWRQGNKVSIRVPVGGGGGGVVARGRLQGVRFCCVVTVLG